MCRRVERYDASMKPDLRLGELAEPRTGSPLRLESGSLVSTQSGCEFPIHADWIDFLPEHDREGPQVMTALMHLPAVSAAYEQVLRPSVDRIRGGQRVDWRREISWATEELKEHRGVVADIACGSGRVGIAAARDTAFESLYCIDRSEPLLAQCVRRSEMSPLRCPVAILRADARRLPLADGSLDAAHIRLGASLWRAIESLVVELARVVKPGGEVLASSVSGRADLRGLAAQMIMARTAGISMPSPTRVRSLCENSGFYRINVERGAGMMRLRMLRS